MDMWLEQLSQFGYSITHNPGLKHRNADFMSRKQCEILLEKVGGSQDKNELDNVVFNIATLYTVSDNNEMERHVEDFEVTTGGAS